MWTPAEFLDLAWTQVWQVTLVAVFVGLISHLLKARAWHPQLANWLWLLVLAKALTPPLWASPLGIFSWNDVSVFAVDPPKIALAKAPQTSMVDSIGGWSGVFLGVVFLVWAFGFVCVLWSQINRWRDLKRMIANSSELADDALVHATTSLASKLGFTKSPRVLVSDLELGPALVGVWNPTIVLPKSLSAKSSWLDLEPIIAHELLHLRRRDTVISALQLLASAIWWFHPLVHWAGRQIEEASERCVDLAVLHTAGCDPATYCRTLVRLLESRAEQNHCLLLAAPAVRGVSVTCDRVRELANVPARPPLWKKIGSLAFCFSLALFFLPGQPVESLGQTCYAANEPPLERGLVESAMLSFFCEEKNCTQAEN